MRGERDEPTRSRTVRYDGVAGLLIGHLDGVVAGEDVLSSLLLRREPRAVEAAYLLSSPIIGATIYL